MDLVFATGNAGKLREAAEILGPGFRVLSPADVGLAGFDVEETGTTFRENSLLKAQALWHACGLPCFADDSGLEVDALGGAPGIYSARYASDHNFASNIERLLAELAACSSRPECHETPATFPGAARFRCVVTLIMADGKPHFFDGACEGRIARERHGAGGFGYDPVFVPDLYPNLTMAELSEDAKNAISHRGVALRLMAAWLATL
ncbi:MAG: RdgB/HAM1 family non-canonical purine NTP pyrophosphatase [Bacteroidales bacterium]|nr:RdgB/HAM1 family non-canonical purine NTP pyrophosphatase [Bacteroidales bacterium]